MSLSIIVAMAKNNAIGKDNQLLWHLPKDFQHFKQITLNKTIIMGRKTWDSLPIKPLPQRQNTILSRQKLELDHYENAHLIHQTDNLAELISKADQQEIIVIGGANLYKQTLPFCQKLYLTIVNTKIDGDAYFPTIEAKQWRKVDEQHCPKDSNHLYDFDIVTLERNLERTP